MTAPLFDDTYDGPRFRYAPLYRPASNANIPTGWIVFSQRPHPEYAHGTVDYPFRLDERQVKQMDLVEVAL